MITRKVAIGPASASRPSSFGDLGNNILGSEIFMHVALLIGASRRAYVTSNQLGNPETASMKLVHCLACVKIHCSVLGSRNGVGAVRPIRDVSIFGLSINSPPDSCSPQKFSSKQMRLNF